MTFSALERLIPDYIRRFEAYIPSKPDDELKKLYGCNRIFRLNNNENPLGPPIEAQRIISGFPPVKASIYPSGDVYYLRQKLADLTGLHPDQFLVGNGANEVIAFVIKAFCREGDNIITADKTFAVYEWVAEFSGFEARLAPLINFEFDDEKMLSMVDERTKILFICNPNNPTGTYWSLDKLSRFMDRINGSRIVVIDEAYFEFVEKEDFPDGIKLIKRYPNLVVFRTMSKMYGLAGLRIGYLAGDREVVDVIRRTCVVYSVNTVAQEAACAAIMDTGHIEKTREMVKRGRDFLEKELSLLKLPFVSNEGNYIMVKLPMSDSLAYRKLMKHGIMVRTMTGFRFPNYIRVTVSHMEYLEAFIERLSTVINREK
ncbi:MAG: histidinol-phosphate transaminase [Desulfatiglans sp.]|nr:histidinol-phosphate transaminase [Desulfatiglans sp.]